MNRKLVSQVLVLGSLVGALMAGPASAATHPEEPRKIDWSFNGPFGKFDQAQLQRGFKVYREVCSACHSMNLVSFRNLGDKGGPFYSEKYPNPNDNPYVKAVAAEVQVADIDGETGDAGAEIGAGWKRTGEKAGDYIAIQFDDPSFAQPIRAHLFRDAAAGSAWSLHWTRPQKREGRD